MIHDGVWRFITDFPLIHEHSHWYKVIFQKKKGRYFLNLYVWDKPQGETQVQSLRWFLIHLSHKKAKVIIDQVVWKRYIKNLAGEAMLEAGSGKDSKGQKSPSKSETLEKKDEGSSTALKYGYEKKIPHGFRLSDKTLHWWVNYSRGKVEGI